MPRILARLRDTLIPAINKLKGCFATCFSRCWETIARPKLSWRQTIKEVLSPRFLVTMALLISVSMVFSRIWVVEYAGIRSDEILQASIPAKPSKFVRIVAIGPQDFRDTFDEFIDAPRLDIAIDRILEFKPAAVVIDLDTSARRFRGLRPRDHAPIIWARDVELDEEANIRKRAIRLLPVRGEMNSDGILWGLPLFPRSLDWTVRSYQRTFLLGTKPKASLHWAAVTQFCSQHLEVPSCSNVRRIENKMVAAEGLVEEEFSVPILHARYAFERFALGDLVPKSHARMSSHSDLSDKIIILGGSYSPLDRHLTPFGVLTGAELIAHAAEAELSPQGQREMSLVEEVGLKIILAVLVALNHRLLKKRYAFVCTMGLLTVLVLFGSVFAAVFIGYRATFVPFLLGIVVDQLYQ